jgi:hypothetical protein
MAPAKGTDQWQVHTVMKYTTLEVQIMEQKQNK